MHLCDLFSDAPDPAQFSAVRHKGGKTKYGVSKMSEKTMLEAAKNRLMRKPNVRMAFGVESNNFIYLSSNTASCVGC